MRLFEIENPRLYLHTDKKYESGQIVTPRQGIYPLGAAIENWLERGRPDHKLSRQSSIYLLDQMKGNAPQVYAIEPIGALDRGHTGWLALLKQPGEKDQPLIDEWVSSYWAGSECPSMPGPWEYRASKLKVIRRCVN